MTDREIELIVEEGLPLLNNTNFILRPSLLNLNMSQEGNSTLNNTSTMNQNLEVEKSDLQVLINTLPDFQPGSNLALFISKVDSVCNHLENRLTLDQSFALNCAIISKIKGEAADFISYQGSTLWSEVRTLLRERYGDNRNEDLLVNAITQCFQKRSETYLEFYSRLLKAGNELLQNISLNITDPTEFYFKKQSYARLSLKSFKNGILEPYRTYLSHFELNTIQDCLNKCKIYDNQKQEWDYSEFLRKSSEGSSSKIKNQPKTPNVPLNQSHFVQQNPFRFQNQPLPMNSLNRPQRPLPLTFPRNQQQNFSFTTTF